MPEQLVASIPGQLPLAPWSRRITWPLTCLLPLCGIPAVALAQSPPPALRACAAETDSARRLACYDREMARLSAPPRQTVAGPGKPAQAASVAPAEAASASPAAPPPQAAIAVAGSTAAAPAGAATAAPHETSRWKKILDGGAPWRVKAHVARLDRSPGATVLHLDNGQSWRQIGRASGDLSLRAGDSVTIEKHFGSYWLSSRYVSDMQVRLEPQRTQ